MTEVADIPLQTLVGKLTELAPALRAAGVTRSNLFGSRARGDARPDSDLGILVDTTSREETPQFDHFKVEDHLGLRAQISMRDLLKPRMAERIADDLVEVF
jgi:uncharacterized protein